MMKKLQGLFRILISILFITIIPISLHAQSRVESNVIYGMYSGLALLMDIHYPNNPNGYGIVVIPGSAWRAEMSLDAIPLKENLRETASGITALSDNGYTLFVINHRASPRFSYPAPVEDAQRAVRYVRHHAANYGIDRDRIGAFGGSSGGYFVSMLGVLDGNGNPNDPSPVNRESSKVQAVVAVYPPTDFIDFVNADVGIVSYVTEYLGVHMGGRIQRTPQSEEVLLYKEASPTSYVTEDDPPFLLFHGDADNVVPFSQSEIFEAELSKKGIPVNFIRVPGGGHNADFIESNVPEHLDTIVKMFDRHLREK